MLKNPIIPLDVKYPQSDHFARSPQMVTPTPKPCSRCKNPSAPYELRNGSTCGGCFIEYVENKGGRRLGAVARDTRGTATGRPGPRRYLAGLSFGPSSTAMTQILDKSAKFHSSKKASPAFEPLIVHVDTNLSHPADQTDTPAQKLLSKYRERFPEICFECVHLSRIWRVRTLDWSGLCADTAEAKDNVDGVMQLNRFFESLPSITSKADMLRLFIRHILLDVALERSYTAVLLGHSTTALAALTLAEVANGRGFAVPWQINDGLFTVQRYASVADLSESEEPSEVQMPIHYPMREVFKNEIMTYMNLMPLLKDLLPQGSTGTTSVVSHKDLSISEVMERYFDSVEGPYSGIVANVVRTTGKLDRAASGSFCQMCAMTLDAQGDSRWAGELGDDLDDSGAPRLARLCYGCKRTLHG